MKDFENLSNMVIVPKSKNQTKKLANIVQLMHKIRIDISMLIIYNVFNQI